MFHKPFNFPNIVKMLESSLQKPALHNLKIEISKLGILEILKCFFQFNILNWPFQSRYIQTWIGLLFKQIWILLIESSLIIFTFSERKVIIKYTMLHHWVMQSKLSAHPCDQYDDIFIAPCSPTVYKTHMGYQQCTSSYIKQLFFMFQ